MKKKRYTDEQIAYALRQAEAGTTVKEVCRKRAGHVRLLVPAAEGPNEQWSMDFVTDRLESGRQFRVLTVVDNFSRESPLLEAAVSMTGKAVARALERLSFTRSLPRVIRVDNGSEFYSQAMDSWAYRRGVQLQGLGPP